ncbi:6316_t:CDS:1, partial [Racocetra fulgida]
MNLTTRFLSSSQITIRTVSHIFRSYTTDPPFKRPGPIPLGDPQEQKEFEDLVRKKQGSFTSATMAIEEEELQAHPDVKEKPPPQFEGEKNPVT